MLRRITFYLVKDRFTWSLDEGIIRLYKPNLSDMVIGMMPNLVVNEIIGVPPMVGPNSELQMKARR